MEDFQKRFTNLSLNILGDVQLNEIESILYVEFLLAVEKEFGIKFSAQEFANLRTLEAVRKKLQEKLPKNNP